MHIKKEKTLGGGVFSTTVSQPDPEGSSKPNEYIDRRQTKLRKGEEMG